LSSVLAAELGISLDKRFQQHDWSRRPFTREELRYLGDDVAYLVALDRTLAAKASALDIEAEIAEECAYKLDTALAPPKDGRPAYVRVKGAQKLDREGRAVLRRLVAAREAIAEAADVPPFKIVANEILLELAAKRPATMSALAHVRGALSGRAGKHAGAWLEAITKGIADGDVPAEEAALFEPVPMNRREVARRREIEARVSGFRRAEAMRRGVDEQVVLPGHCAQAVASLLAGAPPGEGVDPARIAAIAGFGDKRTSLYAARLGSLLVAKANEAEGIEEA
jgi:ribonuclease D